MEAKSESAKEHSAHHRSPSYPVFSLGAAIEKTKAVYAKDKRAATSADVIASHLGYSAAKGPGGRAVSALKQYGLMEESAGKHRISDLGYTLIHFDRDSAEWRAAIVEAAKRPTLFRELFEEHPTGLPSDAALRSDLLKRDFNPASISEVIAIARDTMSLALGQESEYNESMEVPAPMVQTPSKSNAQPAASALPMQPRIPMGGRSSNISTPVGTGEDGQPVFASLNFDAPLKREFVTALKKYLEYLETTLQ